MNLILLFVTGCAVIQLFPVHAVDINAYLDEKLRETKIELIKSHIQETSPVQEKSYRVHWDKLWRVPVMSEHRPLAINIFDGIFILDDDRVMAPFVKDDASSNETLTLHEVYRIGQYRTVKFVRSIVWNTTAYLLMCYELDLCSLHTATRNGPLRFRHTIRHRGIPVDAQFFTQGDWLCLVIANNADKFAVPSVIYRWSGTYMDVVSEVMTIGAESVTAFEHRQSMIIVFAQNDAENPRIGSEVYEFKENSIVRIQFLSTTRPISVHHYLHGDFNFVLMINELESSSVLCWDGRELLDWFSLPEILPHSLIKIFHLDGNTLVVVARDNIVQLYKFHSTSDWKTVNIKRLKDGQKIVDIAVSMNGYTMTVMLMLEEINNKIVYWVEQWEAEMTLVTSDSSTEDVDATRKCLSDLIEMLQERMTAIKEAEASWKLLLPFAKNVTVSKPVVFDNLILQSGTVDNIEVSVKEKNILPPHQIQQALNNLDREVDNVVSKWQEMVNASVMDVLNGKIAINDAFLDEFKIDQMQVDFVNDMDIRTKEAILLDEQEFMNLSAKNVVVHDFEVDSICGIPFQYWTLRNDTTSILAAANGPIEYSNGTIILYSDLTMQKLNIKSLNGTDVEQLNNDLFLVNRSQKVEGKIIYKKLTVENLFTSMLNGVPADKLMTATTNQSFDDFSMNNLQIINLHTKTINGVPVENAARKSRENLIKGKVNLAKLRVMKHFKIDINESLVTIPNARPLQIYENVTIMGDLYLHNAKVDQNATLFIENVPVNVSNIFDNFWTKSSNQTITEDITFESGLTIDSLDTKYLNGFIESDFLYTTMEEIPREFINLHFKNFHVNELFLRNGHNTSYFDTEMNLLTINEKLHLSSLKSNDIIIRTFNGFNVDDVLNNNATIFFGTKEFLTVQARRVFVKNLNLRLLNGRKLHFMDGLRVNDDHQIDTLKVSEIHIRNLELKRLNGIEISLLKRLKDITSSELNRLIVDGDLIVENLIVHQIDGQSVENFFKELAKNNIIIKVERKIEDLIVQNITLKTLHGQNFDEFIDSVLTKSTIQKISGNFFANVITSDNITTNFINEQNISQLMWVDQPMTITGNVTFTDLFVEGDVIISNINGRNVYELYNSLLHIPAKNIDLLKIDGSVSWDASSHNPNSISYLLENAVTKDTDQVIVGNVTFEKDIRAWAVTGPFDVTDEIRSIISDTVIDHGESPIEISGSKLFEDDLVANSLTVKGDVGIPVINRVNIHEFNNSIVRKDREYKIDSPLFFRRKIKIEMLRVYNPNLDALINGTARISNVLPDNVFFENLNVLRNIYLKNLDGIDFDEFERSRVTLNGNHDVWCDVRFNGIVTVTGNANIMKINGIKPSDIVLNNIDEVQVISGVKTFEKNLVVEGDVTVIHINDIDVTIGYEEGVRNDKDVDIYGDLVFKANVWVKNMTTFELSNVNPASHSNIDSMGRTNETLQSLKKYWKTVVQNIDNSSQVFKASRNIFFYLEVEENLIVSAFNVNDVDVLYLEKMTKLYMSSEYPGSHCGLPDDCPCPHQFMAELSDNVKLMQPGKSGEIVKNFYHFDGIYVNVVTDAVSSSKKCTSTRSEEELIIASLMKLENGDYKKIVLSIDVSDETAGYWKDAAAFKYNDETYIFLAVYYNKAQTTHRTNSLLYKVDVSKEKLVLIQEILTDGAWSVWTFKIDQNEVFLLVGCLGESSKSLLYRLDPDTQKLKQVRTFASRSRYVRSLSQGKDHFVLLDNPDTKSVDIYKYDHTSHNFHDYQIIFHFHQIRGIEFFHIGDFGDSDVFVIVTTDGGRFYIYEYMFAGKFQTRLQHWVDGLQTMVPFYYADHHYIFAGTHGNSTIFRIVQQGPH